MSQSLSQIYVHIVFSTKYRKKMIDDASAPELYSYLGAICKKMECWPIKIGGYYDHVHILCKLSKKVTVIKLLEEVKKSSSKWIKTKGDSFQSFYWQNGYAIFSVNPKEVDIVINYIDRQKEHHQKQAFKEECRSFFKKYKVVYDERYVWD